MWIGLLVLECLALIRLTGTTASAHFRPAARHASLGVAAWLASSAEMLHGFTTSLAATQQECVLACRRDQSKLIERQALASRSGDASTCTLREAEGRNTQRRDLRQTDVVKDVTNYNSDGGLLLVSKPNGLALRHSRDAAQRNRSAVVAALDQTLCDQLVEAGVRALTKELVQLNQKLDVRVRRKSVVADGPLLLLDASKIDAHFEVKPLCFDFKMENILIRLLSGEATTKHFFSNLFGEIINNAALNSTNKRQEKWLTWPELHSVHPKQLTF